MNYRVLRFLRAFIYLSIVFFALPLTAQSLVSYQVKPGETLYAIARRIGITPEEIVAVNPAMKAEHIRAGETINLPGSRLRGNTAMRPQTPPVAEPVSKRIGELSDNDQPTVSYKEYKVKRKDTAYGIARANNITVDQLTDANPYLKKEGFKLKRGMYLRIPVFTYPPKPQYTGMKNIRVAVVLPLVGEGIEYDRSLEFYRGFLLGVEDLRTTGTNFEIHAYNEPAPDHSIAGLMAEVMAGKPDLIVGPLFPGHFNDVTAHSSERTKVAIPFSSKVPQVNFRPNVYSVNTPYNYESDFASDLLLQSFSKETAVVMLSSINGDKKVFCNELRRKLLDGGYQVIGLPASSSPAQLADALRSSRLARFVIVTDSSDEPSLSSLLEKVKGLRTSFPSRSFSILGYDRWIPLSEGRYKQSLHEADAYIIASNYYYPFTTKAKSVNERYRQWFKREYDKEFRPQLVPLGYDLAMAFLSGLMHYGIDFGTQSLDGIKGVDSSRLQTDLRFLQVSPGAGYVNRSMWLIHFKKDMTIVKISAR